MQKLLISFLLLGLLLFCFSQNQQKYDIISLNKAYNSANVLYEQSEKLSISAGANELLQAKASLSLQLSLIAFASLLPELEKAGIDSLSFLVRIKTGFIQYNLDSIPEAKINFLRAFALKKKLPAIEDSLLFIPYLCTGGIYNFENQFDSALFYYKKATQLNDTYQQSLYQSNLLYNKLGAMYNETGNYQQARIYLEKVITLTSPIEKEVINNLKINVASLLVKLGKN